MRISLIIWAVVVFLAFIGAFVYFAGGVSATFPPIKKYIYQGNVEQLGRVLEKYALLDSNLKFKISRRDSSNKEDDGGRDIDIELQKSGTHVTYGLVCENVKDDDKVNTEINLVEARDITHNLGGYGIKADGMKNLLNYFESILVYLKKNQQVIINPKQASFFDRFHY